MNEHLQDMVERFSKKQAVIYPKDLKVIAEVLLELLEERRG